MNHLAATPQTSATEENAAALSQAAVLLDHARQHRVAEGEPASTIVDALRHNVELWIGIRTLVKRANGTMPEEVKANLLKLGDFVVGTTLRDGGEMADRTLDTLININLQISEGLLAATRH